jgi:hypothetical protein
MRGPEAIKGNYSRLAVSLESFTEEGLGGEPLRPLLEGTHPVGFFCLKYPPIRWRCYCEISPVTPDPLVLCNRSGPAIVRRTVVMISSILLLHIS